MLINNKNFTIIAICQNANILRHQTILNMANIPNPG